jgi:signal transduction histidine kinase
MGSPATGGYHRQKTSMAIRLRLPTWVQDVLLAVFVAAFQLRGTRLIGASQELARPLADPYWLGYLLLAGSGLVLVLRRRWPVATFAATAAASLVYYAAGYPDGPGWVGLFVAAYTVAAQGDGYRSVQVLAAGGAVLTVGWLLLADLTPLLAAGWVFFRIGTLVMAAALGESVRTRRALAVEALERAERAEQTREEEARRRVDAERLRIAREVHDTVAHAIAAINVHAGTTAHVLDKRPEQARETLVTIERTSARALGELRATLGMLRDPDQDARTPPAGLAQLEELAGLAREAGLQVQLQLAPPPRELPTAIDQAAYRILRESVTNAIRHAGPARLVVSVGYGPGGLELLVADDGHGPRDSDHAEGGGRGIVGMRERAALLGGELTVGPRPGGGFQVRARLPLQPQGAVRR